MRNEDLEKIETVLKYDENGNIIYYKNFIGYEEWNEYDDNGTRIRHKDSDEGLVNDGKWNLRTIIKNIIKKLYNILSKQIIFRDSINIK